MATVNSIAARLFDLLDAPFSSLPPLVGVCAWSLVTAIAMLLVIKRTSDQPAMDAVKRKIHACLFEIRLFSDDIAAILRAQGEILRHNLTYLRLSLKPMVWMLVPLVVMVGQLHFHYGYRGLRPGERAILTVALDQDESERPAVELVLPAGLRLDSPAVWAPALHEVTWRVQAVASGDHRLQVKVGDESFEKRVRVTDAVVRVSPVRPSSRLLDQLTWPAEKPLPKAGPLTAISVAYPAREFSVFGWRFESEYAWMVAFLLISMALAFALRKPFGVTI